MLPTVSPRPGRQALHRSAGRGDGLRWCQRYLRIQDTARSRCELWSMRPISVIVKPFGLQRHAIGGRLDGAPSGTASSVWRPICLNGRSTSRWRGSNLAWATEAGTGYQHPRHRQRHDRYLADGSHRSESPSIFAGIELGEDRVPWSDPYALVMVNLCRYGTVG